MSASPPVFLISSMVVMSITAALGSVAALPGPPSLVGALGLIVSGLAVLRRIRAGEPRAALAVVVVEEPR